MVACKEVKRTVCRTRQRVRTRLEGIIRFLGLCKHEVKERSNYLDIKEIISTATSTTGIP